jgi:phage terminase Nu1 subunit (DNA packaging protein)
MSDISVSDLAELLGGLTERRVQQLADDGIVVKRRHGVYSMEESVTGYIRFLGELIPNKEAKDVGIVAAKQHGEQQRARLLSAKAAREELELAERQGKLVDREKERRAAYSLGRSLRNSMLNIPPRLSVELAAEQDSNKVFRKLEGEIIESLGMIADLADAGDLEAERVNGLPNEPQADCAHWVWC